MDNYKLKIYSSIYDVIETHQLKKYAEYRGKFFLTPTNSIILSSFMLATDNVAKLGCRLINSMSQEALLNENFTILPFVVGIGAAYYIKTQTDTLKKFMKVKYALNKEGISINGKKISIHNLKKAQTVTYCTQTDMKPIKINDDYEYITRDLRAIIIRKRKTRIIIKEQKTYCLENEDFEPSYHISVLPNNANTKEEKKLILKKAYQKYGK